MQIRIKGKVIYTYSVKRLVYALSFLLFCIINQRCESCSVLDEWLYFFRDLTGIDMAVIIMSHYRGEDLVKWKYPYLIWTAVSVIGIPIALVWGKANRTFFYDWIVIILNVALYGYILIHSFVDFFIEKRRPKLNKKFFAVWLVMMLLMIVSRSTYVWPFCYLVMFGCFYMTDYTQKEQEDLFQGMLDGIILGFFVLQGLCFVVRPYDVVRYQGIFRNANRNALFYLEVLAAVFAKLIYVYKKNANRWVKLYYWTGAGALLSFELLTIGRTGWLTAVFLVISFCILLNRLSAAKRWWKTLTALSVSVILTFPLCFGAVRYIPPIFDHPVWFGYEWSEKKVQYGDAWDSEKYIEIDEYFDAAIGRVIDTFKIMLEHSPFLLKVDAAEAQPSSNEPVLNSVQGRNAFLVRSTIYKYYLSHLNFFGHPEAEQGFQLTPQYWVPHAHNIYLQYGTDFGLPVMALFIVAILWGAVLLGRQFSKYGTAEDAGNWMFLLIPAVFGLLEYSWGTGSLSILLLFVAWKSVVCSKRMSF